MVVRFFVFAVVWTWMLQGAAALIAGPGQLALIALAACGPSIAALVITRRSGTRVWRGGGGLWHLVALGWATALQLIGALLVGNVSFVPPDPGSVVLPPLGEELGWRGLAMPQLAARRGPLVASLLVGAMWAIWHLPSALIGGLGGLEVLRFVASLLMISVVMGWLWTRTRGSVTVAIAAHAGINLGMIDGGPWMPALMATVTLVALLDLLCRSRTGYAAS